MQFKKRRKEKRFPLGQVNSQSEREVWPKLFGTVKEKEDRRSSTLAKPHQFREMNAQSTTGNSAKTEQPGVPITNFSSKNSKGKLRLRSTQRKKIGEGAIVATNSQQQGARPHRSKIKQS